MKRLLLILGMLLPPIFSMAQGNANNWVLGSNVQLDFSTTPPTLIKLSFNPGGTATIDPGYNIESSTSVSDANGTLLFYSFGQFLYNGFDHTLVKSDLGTTLDACQGNMVIPKPGTNNQYLLFTVDAIPNSCGGDAQFGSNRGARYYTVTVNAATQSVTVDNGTPVPGAPNSVVEGQAACPTSNPDEYWYVIHDASGNPAANGNFKVYKVTSNGNVVFDHDETVGPTFGNCGAMNIKFNSCYTQMAVAAEGAVTLYSFDIATGTISNPSTASVPSAYGLEFSPNGQYLYVSTGVGNSGETPRLLRFNGVNAGTLGTPTVIAAMDATTMPGDLISKTGHLQLGPDGNIYSVNKKDYNYVGATSPQYVGVILNPNNATPTYNGQYIEINDTNSGHQHLSVGMGLPTFLKSLVTSIAEVRIGSVNIDDESLCVGDNPTLSLNVVGGYTGTPSWKFTPPSGSPVQNFTGTNANPNFNEQGDWTLEISLQDNCGTPKTVTKILTVLPIVTANATVDLSTCPNPTLTGTGNTIPGGSYKWYDKDPALGGVLLSMGNTYQAPGGSQVWVEPSGTITTTNINDTRTVVNYGTSTGNTNITLTSGTASITSFKMGYIAPWQPAARSGDFIFELRNSSNQLVGTPLTYAVNIPANSQDPGTIITLTPIDWNISAGTYTVVVTPVNGVNTTQLTGTALNTPVLSISGGMLAEFIVKTYSETTTLPCGKGSTINVNPCCTLPTISTQPADRTVCQGNTITFSVAASLASGTLNYQWQVNKGTGFVNVTGSDGSGGTTASFTTVATTADMNNYVYKVIVTNNGTCPVESNTATLTVNPVPAAPTVSGNNSPYCHNSNISLTAASTGAPTGTVYTWTLSNSTTSTSNPFTANNATSTTAVPTSVNAS
ncbi:MAG TPA: hypothetical protein VIK89_14485, partial [Cytophagaceae bacterium]